MFKCPLRYAGANCGASNRDTLGYQTHYQPLLELDRTKSSPIPLLVKHRDAPIQYILDISVGFVLVFGSKLCGIGGTIRVGIIGVIH